MKLIEFLNRLFKDDGFLLIDANMNKHMIGHPKKEKPITLKILDKSLHTKLLLLPDLYSSSELINSRRRSFPLLTCLFFKSCGYKFSGLGEFLDCYFFLIAFNSFMYICFC